MEHLNGKGAVQDIPDARDYQFSEVAGALPPFNWSKGYDVEEELSTVLNIPNFKIPTKNQGISSSCGGQSFSYYGQVISALHNKKWEEKSAKFSYAQVFLPGGGSYGRDNAQIYKDKGIASEMILSSYENGLPPSEAFMERKQDITDVVLKDAKEDFIASYANVEIDIDLLAQAIQANHGLVIGFTGENNGTWFSAYPKPPVTINQNSWNHFMYFGKAKLINGKKYLIAKQSWGTVGEDGWQYFGDDYVQRPLMWGSYTLLYKESNPPTFHHTFTKSLTYGLQNDAEVKKLQEMLSYEGFFTTDSIYHTGNYFNMTAGAVKKWQVKHGITDFQYQNDLTKIRFGSKSIAMANSLYSN